MKSGRIWRPRGRVYVAGILGLGLACGLLALAHRGGTYVRAGRGGKVSAAPFKRVAASVPARTQALRLPDSSAQAQIRATYAGLPLSFEPNQGQTDPSVKFLSRGSGYNLFLTANEAVLALHMPSSSREPKSESRNSTFETRQTHSTIHNPKSKIANPPAFRPEPPAPVVLRMRLKGGNPAPTVAGLDELPGKSNYFTGNDPAGWRTSVPTFAKVKYQDVYPGVDLVYYGQQRQLEYDFVVEPGADPKAITLELETRPAGAKVALPLAIDPHGDLVVSTAAGEVRFNKPHIYQAGSEGQRSVAGGFFLKGARTVGFQVGAYDPTQTLIIDPALSYATYLGGTNDDVGTGIAVDAEGNAYVVGDTGSVDDFPTTTPYQPATGGSLDVFVAKLKPDGTGLVYSTYLGGHGSDWATGIAINSAGNVYLTGCTNSDNFPTQKPLPAPNNALQGSLDAFVVELNPSGSGLVFSTYLGGSDADYAQAIAVDATGNVLVTGSTQSADFPTVAPLQATIGGAAGVADAFVAELNPTGTSLSLVFSTYLGGGGADYGQGIALDSAGNILVVGYTYSTNFPTFPTLNPLQAANAGSADAFVAKLNPAGSALLYSTYLGGSDSDRAMAITVDASNNAYVTGETASLDFPTTAGAFQTTSIDINGNGDAFVTELNETGTSLVFSTYLGGADTERGNAIVLDSSRNIYLAGYTRSHDFPTAHPLQATFGGGTCDLSPCFDAFVTALNPGGASLVFSTYLGGNDSDYAQAMALDGSGNAYVTGATSSANFPVTGSAVQPTYGGTGLSGDAFIAKISPLDAPTLTLTPQKLTFADQGTGTTSAAMTVTLTNNGSAPLELSGFAVSGDFSQTNTCGATLDPGGAQCAVQVTFAPTTTGALTGTLTITDNAAGSPHQVSLNGNGTTPAAAVTFSPTSLDFGSVLYNTTSTARTVTVTSSGNADLTITSVATTGNFTQTNDCPTTAMAPGASCTITVTYTPKVTGAETGTVTVTDNATGSPQTVNVTGVGLPEYTLTISPTATSVEKGASSTTFTIGATAPETYTKSITLSCTTTFASASCSFSPASITPTQTSTLTITNVGLETGATLVVTVEGTDGTEKSNVSATINYSDFAVSAGPPIQNIASGDTTTYTVTVSSINGFAETVALTCQNTARDSTCTFAPASVTLDGSHPATSTVTVATQKFSGVSTPRGRRFGPPPLSGSPWLWLFGLVALLFMTHRLLRGQRRAWTRLAAPMAALVLFAVLLSSCQDYNYDLGIRPALDTTTGTKRDNYTLVFTGTFGIVTHSAGVLMSVR